MAKKGFTVITMTEKNTNPSNPCLKSKGGRFQTILLSLIFFYGLALPLIITDYNAGRAFSDQINGHLPAIRFFTEQIEFSDYPSATTPGYHLLLAAFAKFFTQNIVFLKLVASVITAAFIGLFAALLYDRAGKFKAILMVLPMIFSLYIHPDGVWLVPDNLAWLTVAILLIITLKTYPPKISTFFTSGLIVFFAVAVRQPNIWLAAVPWATGLSYLLFSDSPKQKKLFVCGLSILCTVPAFVLLYYFFNLWGGLVPPSFQSLHERGLSFSVLPFFLSIFLVYSVFYTPLVFRALTNSLNRPALYFIAAGSLIGFLIAVLPDTDYNYKMGRLSGFWNFVRLAPSIGHTSVLLTISSTLGGAAFCGWLLLLKKELRFIIFISSLAFTFALIPNLLVLERYFAGFIYIILFIMLYSTEKIKWEKLPALVWIGPVLFTLINLLFLCRGIFP